MKRKFPEIVAHRGVSYIAPENTIAAVKKAWEIGADAVEIDVHLSKDNQIMVIHDEDTWRTHGEYFVIAEHNTSFLRTLDVGSWKSPEYQGEKIPFLQEIIETVPAEKTLYVEIKPDIDFVPALKTCLADTPQVLGRLAIISYHWNVISRIKQAFPDIATYLITEDVGEVEMRDILNGMQRNSIDGVHLYYKDMTPDMKNLFAEFGVTYGMFTVDQEYFSEDLLTLGMESITSNQPDLLRKFFESVNG